MAIEQPQDQAQPVEPAQESQAQPETPIDLGQDPFGEFGQGEQVAGMGSVVRTLLEKFAGKRAPKAAPDGPGAPEAPPPSPDAPEPSGGQLVPAEEPLEAQRALPEVVLGTTRPLANLDYFDNPNTRELLGLMQERGRTPRGITHERTTAQAKELSDVGDLIGGKPSLNWSPAQLTRLRGLLETQAQEVHTYAKMLQDKKAGGIDISTEERAMFAQMSTQLVATQNAVSGLSSQAAQLLNSLKIEIKGEDWTPIAKLIDQSGGDELLDEKIASVARAQPGKQVHSAVKESWGAQTWGTILKWRYNMMLSSPRTHMKNIIGSASALSYEKVLIDPLAYVNNKVLTGVSRAGEATGVGPAAVRAARTIPPLKKLPDWFVEQELPAKSMAASTHGLHIGMREGIKTLGDIIMERELPDFTSKFANELGMRYRPGEALGANSSSAAVRGAGRAASMPTRLLEAEDAFFRSASMRTRLHTLAMDRAHTESGGNMQLRESLYQKYVDSPPQDLMQQAVEYSQKLTFTNNPDMYGKFWGGLFQAARKAQNITPFGAPVMKFVMPFVQTPANLLAYMSEMSGVGQLFSPDRMIAQLGGSPRERAEVLARVEAAAGLMGGVYMMWSNGQISGMGSSDWRTAQLMKTQGWQPNSVRMGDKFYSMNGLDPSGQLLSTMATVFELMEEAKQHDNGVNMTNVAMGVLLSTADMMMDKSYLAGITETIDIISNGRGTPGEGMKQLGNLFASTAVSTVVPNALRDFRRMHDPIIRDMGVTYSTETDLADSVGYRMQKLVANMVPGLSDDLPPRFDWKGDVMTTKGNMLARGYSPIEISEKGPDASTVELLHNNVVPARPKRRIEVPRTNGRVYVDFDAMDPSGVLAAAFSRDVGQARKKAVDAVMSLGEYQQLVADNRDGFAESDAAKVLQRAIRAATTEVKMEYLRKLRSGDTFQICVPEGGGQDCSMQWTPGADSRDAYDWSGIISQYREQRTIVESPGIKGKSKVQPAMPEWMRNERMRF